MGLGSGFCLLRLHGIAPGAFQHQHSRGGQALFSRPSIASRSGDGRLHLADDGTGSAARHGHISVELEPKGLAHIWHHPLCWPHHGDQCSVLQFQGSSFQKNVPFVVIVLMAPGIAIINIHPLIVMFGVFMLCGLSGYALSGWLKAKGQHSTVIITSTDEPNERGLHD